MAQDTSLRGGKSRPGGAKISGKISPGGQLPPCPPTSRAYDYAGQCTPSVDRALSVNAASTQDRYYYNQETIIIISNDLYTI